MAEFTSQQIGYGRAFADTVVGAFGTVPANALIHLAKLRLSHDPAFAPTPESTVAGLAAQEAVFTGYPAGGLTFTPGSPVNLSPLAQGAVSTAIFTAGGGGSFTPDTVYGYWIDDGTNVIAYEAFPASQQVPLAAPGDFLVLVIQLPEQLRQATF